MGLAIAIPLLALVAVLQSSLIPHFSVGGARPELMLIFVVSWSLLRGPQEGLAWAFMGGIFLDLLSSATFGLFTISLLCSALATSLAKSGAFGANIALPMASISVASLLYQAGLIFMLRFSGRLPAWDGSLLQVIALSTLLNVCLMPFIFWPLGSLHRATKREEINL